MLVAIVRLLELMRVQLVPSKETRPWSMAPNRAILFCSHASWARFMLANIEEVTGFRFGCFCLLFAGLRRFPLHLLSSLRSQCFVPLDSRLTPSHRRQGQPCHQRQNNRRPGSKRQLVAP